MAKLKGPFMSIDATGHIGKTIVASHWKGIHKGMKHFKPRNPRSMYQSIQRGYMEKAIMGWQGLTPAQKQDYQQSVANLNLPMSGYNFYLSEYIKHAQATWILPILNGLISWWKFDENIGVSAKDSFSNNDGIITGGGWVPGKINSAISFDGYLTNVNCGNQDSLKPTEGLSLECWMWKNTWGGAKAIMGNNQWSANEGIKFELNGSEGITLYAGNGSPGGSAALPSGVWMHLVITWDRATVRMYRDGGTMFTGPFVKDFAYGTWAWRIGSSTSGSGELYNGILDEIRVYNRPLTLEEVQHNYNL